MEILNASDAKREFGEMLLKAQRAPVGINRNGKPVAVVISAEAYAEIEAFRAKFLGQEIDKGVADIEAGRVSDGPDFIERLKKRVLDAEL